MTSGTPGAVWVLMRSWSALCLTGGMCPFRHISGEKTVVCKHWLRGLCKKGDQCEFLHEYDMTKMPECYFYSKFGWLFSWVHFFKLPSTDFVCWVLYWLILLFCDPSQASAATRSVLSYTSIQSLRSKTVPGMTEASANTVRPNSLVVDKSLLPLWFE